VPYGTWEILRKGKDCAILAVGVMCRPALEAAEALAAEGGGLDVTVVNARFLKPMDRETLDAATELKARIERIRLTAGPLMNLGDVTAKSVPKMMLVAPPKNGGAVTVRSFIPHRAHASVGVLAAVSVATACLLEGSPAAEVADIPLGSRKMLSVEHPTGEMSCVLEVNDAGEVVSSALLRTARKLLQGTVFV